METQTVTVELDPSAAAILRTLQAKAEAQGMTLASLLSSIAEGTNGTTHERPFYETATPDELAEEIIKWMDSHDPNTSALTLENVSRESIYPDR